MVKRRNGGRGRGRKEGGEKKKETEDRNGRTVWYKGAERRRRERNGIKE